MEHAQGLRRAIAGGLAGGAVFGAMMGMMGMLPMIGGMVGMPAAMPGFVLHMMMSAGIGAGFAIFVALFGAGRGQVVGAGLVYGALWWVLGPLTFMPWIMGMGMTANWTVAGIAGSMPSLVGHLIFGSVLGFTYYRLGQGHAASSTQARSHAT